MLVSRCPERIVVVFVLVMCMLVWWWRGQAGAGLHELRTPAVRNLILSLLLSWWFVLAVLWRRIFFWNDDAFYGKAVNSPGLARCYGVTIVTSTAMRYAVAVFASLCSEVPVIANAVQC